jgi:hypothetical protein
MRVYIEGLLVTDIVLIRVKAKPRTFHVCEHGDITEVYFAADFIKNIPSGLDRSEIQDIDTVEGRWSNPLFKWGKIQ